MSFDFGLIASFLPAIAAGAGVTLGLWLVAGIAGALLGFLIAVLRLYGPRAIGWLLGAFVEVMRGTPFLIQLFLLYYGGPFIGLSLDPIPAGLLALTLYGSAYFSEIARAGFEAVPAGHVEAAACVGLSRVQTLRRIIIPEMTMLVLPAGVNMMIVLLKETAVLSIITVPDLTLVLSAIGSEHYAFVESLFLLALIYWAWVEMCGRLGRFAEDRLSTFRFAGS